MKLLRDSVEDVETAVEEAASETETESESESESVSVSVSVDEELTAEDVLEKIERLYVRAASTYLRSKEITRLLWSDVRWNEKGETKSLTVRGGKLVTDPCGRLTQGTSPWQGLAISDYDRMSVLLMEISKVEHEIEAVR
jgi:DNA polymerase-3 subunit epsilon